MNKYKHIPIAVAIVLLAAISISYLIIDNKTEDRFTGTRGTVLESAVGTIQGEISQMALEQAKAWARIECRQILFIEAVDKTDFEEFRRRLKEECK